MLGIPKEALIIDQALYRPTEIVDIYGSSEKAERLLKWKYNLDFFDVLDKLIEEERQQQCYHGITCGYKELCCGRFHGSKNHFGFTSLAANCVHLFTG